jgi:hypothetical protein
LLRPRSDAVAVVDITETEHARFQTFVGPEDTGDRRNERAASGRDQKPVVGLSDTGFGGNDLGRPVDFNDRCARMKHDVVLTVPIERIDENLTGVLRTAQDVGEQDPVVVPIGLVAKYHNVELITATTKQYFLDGTGPRHAVADDHEPNPIASAKAKRPTLVKSKPMRNLRPAVE